MNLKQSKFHEQLHGPVVSENLAGLCPGIPLVVFGKRVVQVKRLHGGQTFVPVTGWVVIVSLDLSCLVN